MAQLAEIETFIVVARTGSFAATARQLAISPAMVGRRIHALEERYDAKLIERTTRSLRLTALGDQFLAKVIQIAEAVDELAEMTRPDRVRLSGRVRVAGPTTLGIKLLAPIVSRIASLHPGLAIELNLSDRNVDLISDGYDLAVRVGDLQSSSMIGRRVGTYRFVCCAAPAYLELAGGPDTPSDLSRACCILNLNLVPRNRWPFRDEGGESFTVAIEGQIEIDNGEAMRAAALAGAGIIYAPRDLVDDDLRTGALVEILRSWQTLTLPIHTLHPSRRMVPRRVSVLIDAIAEGLRET